MPFKSRRIPSAAWRAVVVVGGFAVLVLTASVSTQGAIASADPASALRVAPYSAAAATSLGTQALAATPTRATADRSEALALSALRRDGTSVAALRTLAMVADVRGDSARARKLFSAVAKRSHRDLVTQLWLIEDASQSGDVAATLRAYETTLDGSYDSWPVLFGVLAGATAEPALQAPLAAMLARSHDKEWWSRLAFVLAQNSPDPVAMARIARSTYRPADPEDRANLALLVDRMGAAGAYGQGADLYRRLAGTAAYRSAAGGLSDRFTAVDRYPPYDWRLSSATGLIGTATTLEGGATGIVVMASGGASGEVASRLIDLAPGHYRLSFAAAKVPADRLDRPSVTMRCATVPRTEQLLVTLRATGDGVTQGEVRVPAGCRWQTLAISGSGDVTDEGDAPVIQRIDVTPLARG